MSTITVQQIEQDPASFLRRVEAGEPLVVTRDNRPVAEVTPLVRPGDGPRPFGLCAGQFETPPDFDQPLPDAVLREFEGQ